MGIMFDMMSVQCDTCNTRVKKVVLIPLEAMYTEKGQLSKKRISDLVKANFSSWKFSPKGEITCPVCENFNKSRGK